VRGRTTSGENGSPPSLRRARHLGPHRAVALPREGSKEGRVGKRFSFSLGMKKSGNTVNHRRLPHFWNGAFPNQKVTGKTSSGRI